MDRRKIWYKIHSVLPKTMFCRILFELKHWDIFMCKYTIICQRLPLNFLSIFLKSTAMTRILLLVLFCAMAVPAVVSAQTKFSIVPEAGISVSRWEWERSGSFSDVNYRNSVYFYAAPTAGLHAQLETGKHQLWSLGLRYQKTGEEYWRHWDTTTGDTLQHHHFDYRSLALPMAVGYKTNARIPVAFSLGVQPVWVLKARYARSYHIRSFFPEGYSDYESFDLIKDEVSWYRQSRLYAQLHAVASVFPAKRLKISVGYNTAGRLIHSKRVPGVGDGVCDCITTELNFRPVFRRHDMFLTLAYFLATN